jgi:hypothetical protein
MFLKNASRYLRKMHLSVQSRVEFLKKQVVSFEETRQLIICCEQDKQRRAPLNGPLRLGEMTGHPNY